MIEALTIVRAEQTIEIAESAFYLGNRTLASRVTALAGTSIGTAAGARGHGRPVVVEPLVARRRRVQVFSVPAHLIEELWLDVIPGAVRTGGQRVVEVARGSPASGCLQALAFLIASVEPECQEPISAELVVTSLDALAHGQGPAFERLAPIAPEDSAVRRGGCVLAWLNLDERSQCALMRAASGGGPECRVEIEPAEGIIWYADGVEVRDATDAGTAHAPTVRLMLTGARLAPAA